MTLRLVALAALLVPLASATVSVTPTSDPEHDAVLCPLEYTLVTTPTCGTIATIQADADTYYVEGGPAGIYHETNGCPGFQHERLDCDADGLVNDRDHALGA